MPQLYPCVKPSGNVFLKSLLAIITFLFSFQTYAGFTPAPQITSTGPIITTELSTIILTGNYFTGATAVLLGGNGDTPAASFTVVSDNQITAVVARGTNSGWIRVVTPYGTSPTGSALLSVRHVAHIVSFTPASGTAGTEVTITGFNFTGSTAVSFGSTAAASFTIVNDTVMKAVVGSGSTGQIRIKNGDGDGLGGTFTYEAGTPVPNITSFAPTSGTIGTTITINGNYFTGATAVTIGGTPVTSFTVASDNTINALVAAGTNSGDVRVVTAGGTATLSGFTYVAPDVTPHITSFTPTSASPKTIVTITGTNFTGTTAVTFGGIPATSFTVTSDTEIAAEVAYGATGLVKVVTPGGADSLGTFTFLPAAPVITWVGTGAYNGLPSRSAITVVGGGINIIGHYFTGATAVDLGGTPAASFTVINDTLIYAVVARGTRGGNIYVTGPGGTSADGSAGIGILDIPHIDSFTPTSGTTGTVVTIKGFNFRYATAVSFGQTPAASFTIVSDSTITAIVGAGSTGEVQVIESPGTYSHLGTFTYNSTPAPTPQITSFTPTSGTMGTVVTIKGSNFTGTTAVSIGGTPAASFTVVSDTIINAVVAAGTNSGAVSVTTGNGTATLNGFTYVVPVVKPHITSFTPTSGAEGTVVTIKGSNFTNVTAVSFGGTPAATFAVTDSTITAQVGSGATGVVQVTTTSGSDTLAGFTYMAGMLVAAPNPATGYIMVDHPVSANNAVIKLTNAMGNLVKNVKVIPGNSQTRLDLSGIAPGIYIIWWGDGANASSKRVFIK